MSTPTSLELPDGVRPTTIRTGRGWFAALEASPVSGACDREPALLVPGYTGSKEDFLAIAWPLARHGRTVVTIDMRGQFETPGSDDHEGYSPSALGADIAALVDATGARHLLGHSYGGLIAREGLLGQAVPGTSGPAESGRAGSLAPGGITSFTLMSSGPSALTGPRERELRAMLAALGAQDGGVPSRAELRGGAGRLSRAIARPRAAGSPRRLRPRGSAGDSHTSRRPHRAVAET
ncbi:MAG TPA: alpha/beta fold hydrolase, partial [Streptosporangiaceae bacterium]|nr:alpha/beta fold hydrolase [Streptosporangiaceae bacterium]